MFIPEYLVAALDQLASAKRSMVMAVRAVHDSGYECASTIKEIKVNIGDIEVTIEQFKDILDNIRKK